MSRNLDNEIQWRKDKYSRFEVQIVKETADKFKEYLKENNMSFSEWCKNKINEDLINGGFTMYRYVKSFNSGHCSIIEKDGELYAYENDNWNGEIYFDCWKCDPYGTQLDNDEIKYTIKPIVKGVGEPDDEGNYNDYETIDVEISIE